MSLSEEIFVYLRAIRSGLLERFMLKHGRVFTPAPFTGERRPSQKCFQNAVEMATTVPGLRYAEGFAHTSIIPTLHAWCVDENDRVIDPTWDNPEACAYVGIAFDPAFAYKRMIKQRYFGLFDTGHGYDKDLIRYLDPEFPLRPV